MANIEIDDLKKTSADIAENLMNKKPTFENIEEIVDQFPKQIKRVNFQKPTVESVITVPSVQPTIVSSDINTTDFFSIGSLNVPKQTLFLAIILIVVGIVLWFMTNKNKKPQHQDEE